MDFRRFEGKQVLLIGIGAGGDVVGTLPTYFALKDVGAYPITGGLTWKRKQHDRVSGPRRIDEFENIDAFNEYIGIVNADTKIHDGIQYIQHIEADVARVLEEPVITLDISGGYAGTLRSLKEYVQKKEIDHVFGIDVGGDVLCYGDEPTIRSPAPDHIMLAVLSKMNAPNATLGVFGLGGDGELTLEDFYQRFDDSDRGAIRTGYLGAQALTDYHIEQIERVLVHAKTESTAKAIEVANTMTEQERVCLQDIMNGPFDMRKMAGPITKEPLRDGSRTGEMSALSSLTLYFNPFTVYSSNRFRKFIEEGDFKQVIATLRSKGYTTGIDEGN